MHPPDIDTLKQRFAALNAFITASKGWTTSVPGETEVRFETLTGSRVPDDLRAQGHYVRADGEGERILATSIIERFTRRADGELDR